MNKYIGAFLVFSIFYQGTQLLVSMAEERIVRTEMRWADGRFDAIIDRMLLSSTATACSGVIIYELRVTDHIRRIK